MSDNEERVWERDRLGVRLPILRELPREEGVAWIVAQGTEVRRADLGGPDGRMDGEGGGVRKSESGGEGGGK